LLCGYLGLRSSHVASTHTKKKGPFARENVNEAHAWTSSTPLAPVSAESLDTGLARRMFHN